MFEVAYLVYMLYTLGMTTKGNNMNTETYNYQEELATGLANIARIEAFRQEIEALRVKYAYADQEAN